MRKLAVLALVLLALTPAAFGHGPRFAPQRFVPVRERFIPVRERFVPVRERFVPVRERFIPVPVRDPFFVPRPALFDIRFRF